ncbi:MAG: permease-like cell division protein FtsX [Bacteroidia bacterium]|nr:permease-like cell division protein FtsX [Bacteroidia bacterium]
MRGPRLPLAHSLFSLVLALFVLGLYGLFLLMGQLVLEQARAGLEYRIHLYGPAPTEQVEALLGWLRSQRIVREAHFVSPEEAMEGFRRVAGEEFVRAMEGFNPFPPTFRVTFRGEVVSSDSVLLFTNRVLEWEIVKEVDYPRRLLEVLEKRANTLQWVGLLVGLVMVGVTFLLIFNTVRLAIFARRLEIRTLELVGATRAYIERPFVQVGLFQGLVGAFLAIALLQVGIWLVHRYFLPIPFLLEDWRLLALYGGLIVFGTGVGYIASKLALQRFLQKTLDKLI